MDPSSSSSGSTLNDSSPSISSSAPAGSSSSSSSGSRVGILFDPKNTHWFTRSGTTYTPLYGWLHVRLTEDTAAQTLTFTRSVGRRIQVIVFNSFAAASNPGSFVSSTDTNGVVISVTSRTGSRINEVQRTWALGGTTRVDSPQYTWFTSGSASGRLQYVTYRQQVGGKAWSPIRRVGNGYFADSDPNGGPNDLQSGTQQLPDGSGGWNTVVVRFFRCGR